MSPSCSAALTSLCISQLALLYLYPPPTPNPPPRPCSRLLACFSAEIKANNKHQNASGRGSVASGLVVTCIHSARPRSPGDRSRWHRRCQMQSPHSSCDAGATRAGAQRPLPPSTCVPLVAVVTLNRPAVMQTHVFFTPAVICSFISPLSFIFLWNAWTCIHERCEVRGRC